MTCEAAAADSLSTVEFKEISHLMGFIEDELAGANLGHVLITKVFAEVMDPERDTHLGVIELHHAEDPACFHTGRHLIYEEERDDTPEPGPHRHLVLVDDDDQVIARYSGVYDQEKDRD